MINGREVARVACQQWHASQRLDELAVAVELVASIGPQIIVEIGCDAGGTLYAWRQICPQVYGITLTDNSPATGGQHYPLVSHGATVLFGDSHDPVTLAWLTRHLDGRAVDVLHIDGDHSYHGARTDLDMYAPLVRPGGLVLLHDACNVWDRRVAVPRLWAELRPADGGTLIASKSSRPVGFGVLRKGKDI